MTDPKLLGNGEGHTVLILTDAESRLIRKVLADDLVTGENDALSAFNEGVLRGTDRIKAEFDQEQRKRKEAKQ